MAFNNGAPYTPYGNPYTNPYGQQMMYNPTQQNDTSIIWVKGEAGANAFPVQNGKSVVLFDSDEERFFIKTVDISGMPQPLRIFNYSEKQSSKKEEDKVDMSAFVTRDDLKDILQKYDEAFEKINSAKQQQNTYPRKDNRNGKPVVQRTDE